MRITNCVLVVVVVGLMLAAGCWGGDDASPTIAGVDASLVQSDDVAEAAAKPTTFTARLSGSEEVPPLETTAGGMAFFRKDRHRAAIYYRLIAHGIANIFGAHIHRAPRGLNGPVVATLLAESPAREIGLIATGTITPDDVGGMANFNDLLDDMAAGLTYVNVHTTAHPSGQIRGQVVGRPNH